MKKIRQPLRQLFSAGNYIVSVILLAIVMLSGVTLIAPSRIAAAEATAVQNLPEDVQLAITGIVMRMRNLPADSIPGLIFARGADKLIPEEGFHYPGFNITRIDILSSSPEQGTLPGGVTGIFTFSDNFGRGTEAFFSASYYTDVARKLFVIDKAVVISRNIEAPRLQLFIVPIMKFVSIMKGNYSHAELLKHIAQNAIDTTARERLPSGKDHYAFCFFFLDRLPEEPLIHIQPENIFFEGPGVIKPTIEEHNFLGWRMPVIKCTADLTANPPVTFDVRYSSTDLSQATSTPDLATMTHIGHYEIPPKKDTVRKVDTMARPVEKQNNRQTAETAPAANTSAKMEKIWWTGAGGQRNGPFTLAEITAQAKENTLTAETLVWCKSMDNWQAAGKVPSLKVLFSALPPPLPAE